MEPMTPEQQALAAEHMSLVAVQARKHRNWPSHDRPSTEELIAEGHLALCEAAMRWKPELGPFKPWAIAAIKRAFIQLDALFSHPVRIPRGTQPLLRAMRDAQRAGASTPSEVAEHTGLKEAKVNELWPYLATGAFYLDEMTEIPDRQVVETVVEEEDEAARVRNAVGTLPTRQRQVVEARFGWTTGAPLLASEIADHLGIPLEQVEVAEKRAMAALRSALT